MLAAPIYDRMLTVFLVALLFTLLLVHDGGSRGAGHVVVLDVVVVRLQSEAENVTHSTAGGIV